MPSEIETFRMSAMNRYLQERLEMPPVVLNTRLERKTSTRHLEPGTWVMYFRRGEVSRGAIGAPPKSGLCWDPPVSS